MLDDADSNGTPDAVDFTETTWTDREYVYGPGDVDEFVCQFDRDGNPFYMLQDANLNCVVLMDAGGSPFEQYTFDPYGHVLARDVLTTGAPANRVGFQGLFFDRLEGTADNAPLDPPAITATGPTGLYYARNRHYSPTHGRWIQRDPNETALPIITALAFNGMNALAPIGDFDLGGHYGDGMNVYQFGSGNPLTRRDPSGLFDDYEAAANRVGAENIGFSVHSGNRLGSIASVLAIGAVCAALCAILPGFAIYIGSAIILSALWNRDRLSTPGFVVQVAFGAAVVSSGGRSLATADADSMAQLSSLEAQTAQIGTQYAGGGRYIINRTAGGVQHALDRHFPGGVASAGKSVFNAGEGMNGLISQAEGIAPMAQASGRNFQRIVDMGRNIGVDRVSGQQTSVYTVITSPDDNLITMFPGVPSR